jgi:hypothetical protein
MILWTELTLFWCVAKFRPGNHANTPKGYLMKTRILAAAFVLLASASAAMAACPPGTSYNCSTTYNGKQSCGCR